MRVRYLDKDLVRSRLDRLLHELDAIEAELPSDAGRYSHPGFEVSRYALEHRLYITLQSLLDCATHVALAAGVTDLQSNRDAMDAIARLGIAPGDLAERLAGAAGLRNALAHTYLELDHSRVYEALRNADDVRHYAAALWEWTLANS